MNAATAFKNVEALQGALHVLAALQLATYLWPPQATVHDGTIYDFIVVGAGTAGSVVAHKLSEIENVNVLLIEAGGDPPFESVLPGLPYLLKRSRFDWNYTAENNGYDDKCHLKPFFEITLGKMLGGTSSLNYMVYHRGQPQDYNSWAEQLQDPIWKWENVLPYFRMLERLQDPETLKSSDKEYYGEDGYVGMLKKNREAINSFLDAYKEPGQNVILDFNKQNPLGFTAQTITRSGQSRQGSAYAFLSNGMNKSRLHVLKNTLVTKILFDSDKNAIGVEAATEDGKTLTIKATKEVVISAGVFNTPKLLMLSGIGPEKHLESKEINVISDLPVGENLQDHVCVIIIQNLEQLDKQFPRQLPHKLPGLSFTGFVPLDKTQSYPDYQIITYLGSPEIMLVYCSFIFRFTDEICNAIYAKNRLQAFNEILNINPKSRGKVMLKSKDPFDSPLIQNGFFSNKEDVDDLVKYVQDFNSVMNTTYYKNSNAKMQDAYPACNKFPRGSDEYWRCYIMCVSSGLSHFTSTCPMGSVVDSRLRVLGVTGLRVIDASVMPNITRGNPYGPVLMIGLKGADLIKQDYNL